VILSQASSAIALADHAPALRCVSTDGIKESDRCEFWRASTVPVFGSLEVKLLENRAFDGSFQFTTSTILANISRIGTRRWPAPFLKSGLAIFSHAGLMKRLTKPVVGATHATILDV
jgi:hypothetical protein